MLTTEQRRTRAELLRSHSVDWYGRGGDIKRMGPFLTELQAWEALRGLDGEPVEGAAVWCEEKKP
jgi:hypothetical protein